MYSSIVGYGVNKLYGAAGRSVPDKTGENKHRSVATMNYTINNWGPRDPGIEKVYNWALPTCVIPSAYIAWHIEYVPAVHTRKTFSPPNFHNPPFYKE
jgi:hypothetical protein